jgi:hypothetical protein
MMRTLELKSRHRKSQQQAMRTQNSNTVHHDDEFTGGNFYTTQESFKVNVAAGDNAGSSISKIQ